MPLGILFWVLYLLAIVIGWWSNAGQPDWPRRAGFYGILWLLVGILGWAVFGPAVK